MKSIIVFASGAGSNFSSIVQYAKTNHALQDGKHSGQICRELPFKILQQLDVDSYNQYLHYFRTIPRIR